MSINETSKTTVLIALILVFSGHALATSTGTVYGYLLYVFFGFIAYYYLNKTKWKLTFASNQRTALALLLISCFTLLINYLTHFSTESIKNYINPFVIICGAYLLSKEIDPDIFANEYVRVVFVLCIISLICFYGLQRFDFFDKLPTIIGYDAYGHLTEKYHGFLVYYKFSSIRNSGPFWEPGIFASYILIALLFVNRIDEKKKRVVYYIVFSITVFSTASTAGYMIFFLVLIYGLMNGERVQKKELRVAKSLLAIICIVTVIALYFNLERFLSAVHLNNSLTFSRMLTVSENERMTSVLWNLERISEKPLFGYGYSGIVGIVSYGEAELTNSSLKLMTILGVGGVSFTLFLLIGIFRQQGIGFIPKLEIAVIILLIFNKENHDTFVFAWFLIFTLNTTKTLFVRKRVTLSGTEKYEQKAIFALEGK